MANSIIWFENAKLQTKAYIHFNESGNFSFNCAAQRLLPRYVKFGYDASTNLLLIREGQASGDISVKKPSSSHPVLTTFMYKSGIIFPVSCRIEDIEPSSQYWKITPEYLDEATLIKELLRQAKSDPKSTRQSQEMQLLIKLYDSKIKSCCYSTARTIPIDDRRQLAIEGFINAFFTYKPNFHNFSDHALSETRKYLKSHSSNYSGSYREPYQLQRTSENGIDYDIYPSCTSEKDYTEVITNCDLSNIFTDEEEKVYQLQTQGYERNEICRTLHLNACQYNKVNASLKRKLRTYHKD